MQKVILDGTHYRHNSEDIFDTFGYIRTLILEEIKTIHMQNQNLNIGELQGVFLYGIEAGEILKNCFNHYMKIS